MPWLSSWWLGCCSHQRKTMQLIKPTRIDPSIQKKVASLCIRYTANKMNCIGQKFRLIAKKKIIIHYLGKGKLTCVYEEFWKWVRFHEFFSLWIVDRNFKGAPKLISRNFCKINFSKIYSHILTSNRFQALIRVVLLAKGIFYVKLLVSRKKLKKFNKKIFSAGR